MTRVTATLFPYMHTNPFLRGEVGVEGMELELVSIEGQGPRHVFRKMAREHPFGMSEMGIAVAIATKEYNLPFTAIPVFPVRRFDYHVPHVNIESGVKHPKDLEGKRVAGGSLQTDVDLHCMAMLRDVYGVDLSTIEWVATNDNHVAEARPSKNSTLMMGASVAELLDSGEVAACVTGYSGDSPKVKRLIDDVKPAQDYWMSRNSCTPIHHTIVIANELLESRPGLADDFYNAFVQAKKPFIEKINRHEDIWDEMKQTVLGPAHDYGVTKQEDLILPDPIPYGIEPNRGALETILGIAYESGYLSKLWAPEEIFATAG